MLLARNPDSFRAFFRGYPSANRYWDAPDGLRYWRGRFEIDRGQPDDAGLRRVDDGAKAAKVWDGPEFVPDGIGLYEQDEKGAWWPTEAALASGFQPCSGCELTNRKRTIVATPVDPHRIAAFIASAEDDSRTKRGRPLDRDELAQLLRWYPDRTREPSQDPDRRIEFEPSPVDLSVPETPKETGMASSADPKARIIRKLLELRAREAPLGSSGYRGVLTQKAIADVADVPVREVTQAAIELDREMQAAEAKEVD